MNDSASNQNGGGDNSVANTLGVIIIACAIAFALLYITDYHRTIGGGQEDVVHIFVTSEVDTALLAYKANTGSYPTTKQGLQALLASPAGVKGWRGPYLTTNDVPKDPWGNFYQYAYPSTHGQPADKYDCWSLGPDGKDGTDDDTNNWPSAK